MAKEPERKDERRERARSMYDSDSSARHRGDREKEDIREDKRGGERAERGESEEDRQGSERGERGGDREEGGEKRRKPGEAKPREGIAEEGGRRCRWLRGRRARF